MLFIINWVPPPSSCQLASCCFFRSSFSFSLTGSGTGMSSGAFRLLRLASLRAGSWCRGVEGLEAGAGSHLLTLMAQQALPLAPTLYSLPSPSIIKLGGPFSPEALQARCPAVALSGLATWGSASPGVRGVRNHCPEAQPPAAFQAFLVLSLLGRETSLNVWSV